LFKLDIMNVDFNNIYEHVISMDDFSLKWRFTDEKYCVLPEMHLNQIKPLDKDASAFLWNYILETNLHANVPFKKKFFRNIDTIQILEENKKEIKKWLYQRGLPFEKEVFLSYQPNEALIVPWKILIKYFDEFHYQGSDDLTVIDQSLEWALLFFHMGEIYWGTNKNFYPGYMQDLIDDLL
jgi:hypothetical protein